MWLKIRINVSLAHKMSPHYTLFLLAIEFISFKVHIFDIENLFLAILWGTFRNFTVIVKWTIIFIKTISLKMDFILRDMSVLPLLIQSYLCLEDIYIKHCLFCWVFVGFFLSVTKLVERHLSPFVYSIAKNHVLTQKFLTLECHLSLKHRHCLLVSTIFQVLLGWLKGFAIFWCALVCCAYITWSK